jgi:hypothetical protein
MQKRRHWLPRSFTIPPPRQGLVWLAQLRAEAGARYAHGLSRMSSPGQFSLWFRSTVGLDKKEGAWQISHLHASVPFYMDDTMKAALDLVPLRR